MKLSLLSALCLGGALISTPALADDPGFNPLGPVRLGAVAGVGAPALASGQLVFKYAELVGANFEYGGLPTTTFGSVNVNQNMWDASLRWYPFKGAFYIDCGVGQQTLHADGQVTQAGITGRAGMDVKTTFIMPRFGLLHRFGFGLALGADVGVEIPVEGSTSTTQTVTSNFPVPPGFQLTPPSSATDVGNQIKTTPIPVIHLLQLGYIF